MRARQTQRRGLPSVRALTESLEATGSLDPLTLQLQMVALLYLGDTVAARHLWRCHAENTTVRAALGPWWKVGAAMHTHDSAALWQALQALPASMVDSPLPVAQYAQDIAQACRWRVVYPFWQKQSSAHQALPYFLVPLLGFASAEELQAFIQQCLASSMPLAANEPTLPLSQQAGLVAFLEAQLAL